MVESQAHEKADRTAGSGGHFRSTRIGMPRGNRSMMAWLMFQLACLGVFLEMAARAEFEADIGIAEVDGV
jgi:hypothetical protein